MRKDELTSNSAQEKANPPSRQTRHNDMREGMKKSKKGSWFSRSVPSLPTQNDDDLKTCMKMQEKAPSVSCSGRRLVKQQRSFTKSLPLFQRVPSFKRSKKDTTMKEIEEAREDEYTMNSKKGTYRRGGRSDDNERLPPSPMSSPSPKSAHLRAQGDGRRTGMNSSMRGSWMSCSAPSLPIQDDDDDDDLSYNSTGVYHNQPLHSLTHFESKFIDATIKTLYAMGYGGADVYTLEMLLRDICLEEKPFGSSMAAFEFDKGGVRGDSTEQPRVRVDIDSLWNGLEPFLQQRSRGGKAVTLDGSSRSISTMHVRRVIRTVLREMNAKFIKGGGEMGSAKNSGWESQQFMSSDPLSFCHCSLY